MKAFCKILLGAAVITAGFLAADRLGARLAGHIYAGSRTKLEYAAEGCDEQLLIFGYSRAQHHYAPEILSEATGMSVYNFGTGGQNIYYHYALLNAVLAHHTPETVILELGHIDYMQTPSRFDRDKLGKLAPLYYRNDSVASVIRLRGPEERYKFALSHLYAYNSTAWDILYGKLSPDSDNSAFGHNGYVPIDGLYDGALKEETNDYTLFDASKIACLERFIERCREREIDLIIAISPAYHIRTGDRVERIAERIYSRYGIEILDCEQLLARLEYADCFKDELHMNRKGAEFYTRLIARRLKQSGIRNPEEAHCERQP